MKAFLKGGEGMLCPMGPKVTTIGREGCDIIIQMPGVDAQHAVIEFHDQEDCWVIQDLNTAQGTYVNDCRIQNATVRVQTGDIIRFGYNGTPYEFQHENTNTECPDLKSDPVQHFAGVLYPPVQPRPGSAWPQPITIYDQQQQHQQQLHSTTNLPYLATSTAPPASVTWTGTTQVPLPRPPLRSRPLSAGASAVRRGPCDMRFAGVTGPPVGGPLPRSTSGVGWMGSTQSSINTQRMQQAPPPTPQQAPCPDLLQLMQEKEQKILQLTEENSRLRVGEFDAYRKEQLIQQLQQENGQLQNKLHQEPSVIMGGDVDVTSKLLVLEAEVNARKDEVASLKEQLNNMKGDSGDSHYHLRQELNEKVRELNNVRNELERVKKDKNITSGLVTQMQRDMSSKRVFCDSSISKLTREIEMLKKELRDRDVQVTTLNNRVSKLKDTSTPVSRPGEDRSDVREKELVSLRQKFKASENKVSEQLNLIGSLREELDKTKQMLFESKDVHRKLQGEVDAAKSQFVDMQRTERVVRVDMEQSSKRLERFRNRVIQVTFSTPGIKAPETEITDDELIETMKKLIDERTSLTNKIKDLKEQVRVARIGSSELIANGNKLKEKLMASVDRLKTDGRLSVSLRQELTVIQSLSTEEALLWVRDLLVRVMTDEQTWATDIEEALEKCGANVKLTNDAPGSHIQMLFAKWESAIDEKERLGTQLAEMEQSHKEEMKQKLDALKEEMGNRLVDAVEKARLEEEEKLNRAIDSITAVETEKREIATDMEKKKVEELEASLESMRQSLTSKQEEDKDKLEQAAQALAEMASLRALESELREQIAKLDQEKTEQAARLEEEKEETRQRGHDEAESFKEQVKQHAVTICTMEERIVKLTKKNKDYQDEVEQLKKVITEIEHRISQHKPSLPPKPKVVIQRNTEELAAMEHLISVLRRENGDLKKQFTESQDVIMGLRRDLAGASARLSDITGELSETQKQEMEYKKELLVKKEKDLTESRQQLAKLSQIVDKQKEEIKKIEEELSKEQSVSSKLRAGLEERTERLRQLETRLSEEKEEQKKQLELLDQEGRITSELSALGSQCRGERHEQVITRQREALAELRQRVKVLESVRPPLPSQDQALQQVISLKKELAEMRVNQAISEDRVLQGVTSLDREIGKARGLITPANVEADMERSAHRETMDALECSETTYMTLLRAMASCLEMEAIDGLRPMAHIPRDERERLTMQRESSCEILAQKINILKERTARKDDLLQGYERDLAKLRQAQETASSKTQQVHAMENDMRMHSQESELLRESLNRTRDRLNQEKRLNTAIKQKKTFHLENERAHLMPRPGSARKTEDHKTQVRKRAQKDLLHRKNYEISMLKQELNHKDREMVEKDRRMYSIESSLGIESPVEVTDCIH
ncbi:forkhead-associated domain-containing protein 1-like isoform X3 [Haliotis rufescens]|uniref:forkhead-associated domain-containing protein 1-like isoform X3 n=1 Tax=Haliotis rufescens TaxID=6454 RepID=UPI00201EE409|nr:forkhead-associated domain-containing protein 1-like isoform X3 [Haliotis rufescens]